MFQFARYVDALWVWDGKRLKDDDEERGQHGDMEGRVTLAKQFPERGARGLEGCAKWDMKEKNTTTGVLFIQILFLHKFVV